MVKPVSLSDPAFAALRKEKRKGESDSDVVLRLLDEVKKTRKDLYLFLRLPRRSDEEIAAHKGFIETMRETDRRERHPGRWSDA